MFAAQQDRAESLRPLNQAIAEGALAAFVPLFWEIGNLKRTKPANTEISFATQLFLQAWQEIAGGVSPKIVAIKIASRAVAAAQLGAIDAEALNKAGLSRTDIQIILERSFDLSASPISEDLQSELRANLFFENKQNLPDAPDFAQKLAGQPRSGATKQGAPRLVFDAPENHAEHCITVAVYAVLLAPLFDAAIETVFLMALTHHFHNAYLPDAGFAGEELLGEFLPKIFQNLRQKCLSQLPESLHASVRQTFALTERADAPESKAFHAADVIDRVLQMRHHAEANGFTLKYALEEMELVHAGAVQSFHYQVLREAKLI